MRWMKLEPIIQSEISQKEKNNTVINAYIYIYVCVCVCMGSRKMLLKNLFAGQQWRCRHREQTCGPNG